jgi:hypothetical protein
MGLDNPERPMHPDERAGPDHQTLQPSAALEGPVDEAPMKTNRMTGAHRYREKDDKSGYSAPRHEKWSEDQRSDEHAAIPERASRIP